MKYFLVILIPLTCLSLASPALAETLSVEQYLKQIQEKHSGIQGSAQTSEGALAHSREGSLAAAPSFFAAAQWGSDAKVSSLSLITYDKVVNHSYTVGIQQTTRFGLNAKASVGWNYFNFYSPSFPLASFYENRPSIELSQSLWGGGFGRNIRAQITASEAQSLASVYGNRFQIKNTLMEGESSYWRLALARKTVTIQQDALDRANKIFEWNNKRAQMHLTDPSDALQAKALVEVRKLELKASEDELREASRALNSLRGLDSEQVDETLVELGSQNCNNLIARLTPPARAALRDDVKAAQEVRRLTQANAQLSEERTLPSLDIYGSYAWNGHDSDVLNSLSNSFSSNRPTEAIGLRFSVPLDLKTTANSRSGWIKEQIGAEKTFERKLFEQDQAWTNLNQRFTDAKKRLDLSRSLEQIQEEKLKHERDRLQRGRTVTYQVLMFEQDYAQAQLNTIRTETEVLNLFAQLKLFRE